MEKNSQSQQKIQYEKQQQQIGNNMYQLGQQKASQSAQQKSFRTRQHLNQNMRLSQNDSNFFDQFDSTLQIQDDSPVGLTILPQNQTNQVLQLDLFPNQKIYIRGNILYSNANISNVERKWGGQGDVITYLKEYYKSGGFMMRKIHNGEDHIVYLGVVSEGGKILVIDNNVYGDQMYFRKDKLIMSTVSHQNGIIKNHPKLSGLQNWLKVSQDLKTERTIITLQSKKNCFTIQKYLAPNQNFFVRQKLIICLSQTVKITKELLDGSHIPCKLTGPGWVFIQNQLPQQQNFWNLKGKGVINILVFVFITTILRTVLNHIL